MITTVRTSTFVAVSVCGLFSLVACSGCGSGGRLEDRATSSGATERAKEQRIIELVQILRDCPRWPGFPKEARMLHSLKKLRKYPLDDIRKAMVEYLAGPRAETERAGTFDRTGKLHVVNSYLFAVPTEHRVGVGELHYGGWSFPASTEHPDDQELMNLMWPLAHDGKGGMRIVAWNASYLGPPFSPIWQFDGYRKAFGKRVFATRESEREQ